MSDGDEVKTEAKMVEEGKGATEAPSVYLADLEWGLKEERRAPRAWGARAILIEHGQRFELLWDRQTNLGPKGEAIDYHERRAFVADVNDALPLLRRAIESDPFDPRGSEVRSWTWQGVTFRASPNGSHGYLYITATPAEAGEVESAEPPPERVRCKACRELVRGPLNRREECAGCERGRLAAAKSRAKQGERGGWRY